MRNHSCLHPAGLLVLGFAVLAPAVAQAKMPEYHLTIENHEFSPAELTIPAGAKVQLLVHNADATPEEFESYDLNREKIVAGNGRIKVYVGPLRPGRYKFFGEFHADTAQGVLVVK